jgi:hypothetical protein
MAVTVISYPTNEINDSFNTDTTFEAVELVKYVWVNMEDLTNDTYIEVVYNGVTITLDVIDECRYTPVNIMFQNVEGAEQTIQFFKARTDEMEVKAEVFESDRGQPSAGFHQMVKYNVQAKSKFKVNSGFMLEAMNDSFKQLFLSERIWWLENGTTPRPLNIASTNFEYKTRQKDRLISYEIEFEFAFNEINNV